MNKPTAFAIAFAASVLWSAHALADDKTGASAGADVTAVAGGQMKQWDQVDTNKDGYLSKEEAKEAGLAGDFATTDVNADGRISKDEFAAIQGETGAAGPAGPADNADKAQKY